MEDGAIMKMVEDAFRHCCFIIDATVSDNDSTMQDVIKHPPIGARGQVLKSPKGKIDEEIPVTYFLSDPSHHVEVAAKHIFFIVNNGKTHQCVCTKAYAPRINKYWGFMIKNIRKKV